MFKMPQIPDEVKQDIHKFKEYIKSADPQTLNFIVVGGTGEYPSEFVDLAAYEVRKRENNYNKSKNLKPDTMEDLNKRYSRYKDPNAHPDMVFKEQQLLGPLTPNLLMESMKEIENHPLQIKQEDMNKNGINLRFGKVEILAESDGSSIIFNNGAHNEIMRQNYLNELKKDGLLDDHEIEIDEDLIIHDIDISGKITNIEKDQNDNEIYTINVDDYEDM